jgi:hypothetical protein
LNTNQSSASPSGIDAPSFMLPPGNGRLSPFAKLLSTLQQLPQSDTTKYVQVIQPIATNLQKRRPAQSEGVATAANQLNQLACDFTNASKSGQLPNIQDLAQAVGGHHHHVQAASVDSGSDGDSSGKAAQAAPRAAAVGAARAR